MKVIITGATGMVGKGILLECIESAEVSDILLLNRKSTGITHPKVKEILHSDFANLNPIKEHLQGYDACFYSMGVSALGLSEEQYTHITYTMTVHMATLLKELNPNMVFNYVSGTGTDSSEKGKIMWARVKGKTENAILTMGFKDAYAFRPGMIIPEKGVKSSTGWYNALYVIFRPLFPLFRKFDSITSSVKVGKAMINSVRYPQTQKHLENPEINALAKK
ncbi:SDR family oxidoreductase [Algivirga pacifica]|uniref:Epimerase n=1 Tax=Algivirga pacifica TaxID=1162670 RepID=A0ABP9DKK5_9BACT